MKIANSNSERSSGINTNRKTRSAPVRMLIRLIKEKPLGTAGAVITLALLLIGLFANQLAPYPPNAPHVVDALAAPSAKYILGTDNLGRDLLSRIIFGARISVVVGLVGALISVSLSTILGTLCGYFGGKFDLLVQRFVDAWMCFPGMVIILVVMSILGQGMWQVILVLGIQTGISGSRVVRSAVIGIKGNVYLQAAVAIGGSTPQILAKHVLPNILAPIIIMFSMAVPNMIMSESGLSFLGYGIPPPTPSWGGMLSGSARAFMFMAPWMAIWPGVALAFVVYGVNMFGDALRDILDPRLRGGVGRYGVKVKKAVSIKSNPGTPQ